MPKWCNFAQIWLHWSFPKSTIITHYLRPFTRSPTSVTRCWIKKVAQMFSKVAQIISSAVFTSIDLFQNSPKVNNLLGYFFERICCQELPKIAQSGHTGSNPHPPLSKLQRNSQIWSSGMKERSDGFFYFINGPTLSFFKWAILGLFSMYFCLFKQTLQFLQQIYVKKC